MDFRKCSANGKFESRTNQNKVAAHFVDDGAGPGSLKDHSNFWGVYL